MTHRTLLTGLALAPLLLATALPSMPAAAKVTAEEAARLTGDLTPMGAIRAGNADGTIPDWTGGITTPPAGFQIGDRHPDPFAGEEPRFVIDSSNVGQYADRLTAGHRAMFDRYPNSWRMAVYPTHRTASYPQRIYDRAIANATTAELVPGGNGVTGAAEAIPFPIPQNGLEAIWNHLLRYRGGDLTRTVGQVAPTPGGDYTFVNIEESIHWLYQKEGATLDSINNQLAFFLQEVTAPARLAGTILLVHESLNQVAEPRNAWTYNPGQRRVRRAPNIAYDNPGTASDGQRTTDDFDMFNGAPDRYDWELVGRKELIVPYNAYRLHSGDLDVDDIVSAGHLNPEHLRYELHRVWVVEATLKPGTSHIYARRTFYLDEDSWQIVAVDNYDARGDIWRVGEAHTINHYEIPMVWDTMLAFYDLQNGRYLALGLDNDRPPYDFDVEFDADDFTPQALRRLGSR